MTGASDAPTQPSAAHDEPRAADHIPARAGDPAGRFPDAAHRGAVCVTGVSSLNSPAALTNEPSAAGTFSGGDPVALTLPLAPVVNKLWAPVRTARGARFVKRTPAQDWSDEARWRVVAQRAGRVIDGLFAATIFLPETAADIDARIKPTLDACQHGGAISNDKHCRRLLVEIDPSLPRGLMRVDLHPLPPVERAPRRTKGIARKEPTP